MYSNDITFCVNPRCLIKQVCRRSNMPDNLEHISIASFGHENGDPVKTADDCDMYLQGGE